MLSLSFNWSLYYFRKWILNWPEERNWGEHYPEHLERERLDRLGNVAIFNQNPDKYSETFIRGETLRIPNRSSFFHGRPMPLFEKDRVHLAEANIKVRELLYGFLEHANSDITGFDTNRIADRLLENRTAVMVAHFGPMGVALLNVKRKTGIPLIVVFHGYDAWNRKQLSEHGEKYRELFVEAACVVGVSRDICAQLEKLGCDPEKIEYLPDHLDLGKFRPVERKKRELRYLYVGRFSKTKAPMLVVLAFSNVLRSLPDARLVMGGGDDGEDLHERCIMLAMALGIRDRIDFKGALSHEQVCYEMEMASIFVQHSVTTPIGGDKEGTPVGIMEAMAMGLPIVATDHAGIAEMITDGETGFLVNEYDIDAMAERMIRLGSDGELRERMGSNAAEGIRNNERVTGHMDRFLRIIDRYKIKP